MTSETAARGLRVRLVRRAGIAVAAALLAAGALWWTVGLGPEAPARPGSAGMAAVDAGRAGATMMPGLAPGAPHALRGAQVDAMVASLVARLQARPADAEGWAMLARTHMALSRHAEALAAFRRSIELRPLDATLLADYADALALNNGGKFEGEPMLLIERALRIDPGNAKALTLAGTAAATSRLAAPAVSGTVRLAAALAGQAAPEDTVFVFARPAEGSRMPLAILRKQVKDLPLDFRFEVPPAVAASRLVVVARISPTGQPTARSGDLEGRSPAVAPGAVARLVEINARLP